MEELEEELATFKDRYASSAEECSRLSRKLDGSDGGEGGPFYVSQFKMAASFSQSLLLWRRNAELELMLISSTFPSISDAKGIPALQFH